MSTLKRAFLYTMRKKTKTLILFLVLVTISTFILTGLSIYKAADDSALSLRQSVGGSIRLELDENNRKNWLSTFINSFQKNLLSSSEVSLSMTKTGDFIAGQRTIMRKNVETSDRKHTRRFVSYCSVFRQIICVRPCTMRLWHFIVYRRIDW